MHPHRRIAAGRIALLGTVLVIAGVAALPANAQVLVQQHSAMKYRDFTTDPGFIGLEWTLAPGSFDDSGWLDGTYGVGYQDGAGGAVNIIQTPVPTQTKSVFTRAHFNVTDPSTVTSLFLGADWDDGYIAWINGAEIYRSPQMPTGVDPVWNTDPITLHESSNAVVPDYGEMHNVTDAGVPALLAGDNVLVVAVWNGPLPSSDLVVVPKLEMNLPLPPARGPYLQNGTDTSITVRWRTDSLTDSRVQYGDAPGNLTFMVDDPVPVTNHEVELTGLLADTVYFYSAGSSTTLFSGADTDHFFRTAPSTGTGRKMRVWVLGDSGTANANAWSVRDAYEDFTGADHTGLWLMLGDNAYGQGTDDQYQAAVFNSYPDMLKKSVLFPSFGNHDAVSSDSATQRGPYFDSFTLPPATVPATVPYMTEAFYSYDFGNVHFIALDSADSDRSAPPAGEMLDWLEDDLAATVQDWIIAYWHHPPYSKGGHNSDTEIELIEMRQNALPVLEAGGVDLVLAGHSHAYERSYFIDGHYGLADDFNDEVTLPAGFSDGRFGGDGPYQKPTAGPAPHEGTVYVVAGSSGQLLGGPFDHPAMFIEWLERGSVILDIEGNRLEATFINNTTMPNTIRDTFAIVKGTGSLPTADFDATPKIGPVPLAVQFTDLATTNTAAWDWDFDNDAVIDSTERQPATVYATPGIYAVRLTVTNQSGSAVETKAGFVCASEGIAPLIADLNVAADSMTLGWSAVTATTYDVVKGDLALLYNTGGDFTAAVTGCLEDGDTDLVAVDPAGAPGDAFFYLVRGVSLCDEPGGWDSGGGAQAAPRDAAINASLSSCP